MTRQLSPLEQASRDHLDDCQYRNLARATLDTYAIYEQAFIDWCGVHDVPLTLASLNAANVKAAAETIRVRKPGKRSGEFAKRTFVSIMKLWAAWLVDHDQIEHPIRVRLPKVTKVARRPLELHEVQAIRGAMTDSPTGVRDIAAFRLLLATGIRIGELCRLTLDDVDMKAYTLKVRGKGAHERILRFGDGTRSGGKTVEALRDYLRVRRAGRSRAFFVSATGWPLTPTGFRTAYGKACARAGVADRVVHRTRHSFATHFLLRHRGDVEGLRYLMGHLSDDQFREYTGQAGRILAELDGDEVGAAAMLDGGRMRPRADHYTRPQAATDDMPFDQLLDSIQRDPELRQALLKALLRGAA